MSADVEAPPTSPEEATPEPTGEPAPAPSGGNPAIEGACPAPGENAAPGAYPTCGVIQPGAGNDGALAAISQGSSFYGFFLLAIFAVILARLAFKKTPRPQVDDDTDPPFAPTVLEAKATAAARPKGWYPLADGEKERHWNGEKWTKTRTVQKVEAVNLAEERLSPEEAEAILEENQPKSLD